LTVTLGKEKVGVALTVGVKVMVGVNVSVGVKVNVGVSVSIGVKVKVDVGVSVHEEAVAVRESAVAVACDSADGILQDARNKISENITRKYFFI
jgi:hypothetical protein